MSKVSEPLLPVWLSSPPKLAEAVAVPALVLSAYETDSVASRSPAPVAFAVHGSIAPPV